MAEIFGVGGPLPTIPDDLSLAQFILDAHIPTRPIRKGGIPWLIEDRTGRKIGLEELRARTYGLANAFASTYKIQEEDVVCLFSPNHVVIWATHRLGAIVTAANPSYTASELAHQLKLTESRLLLVHPDCLDQALEASRMANISSDRIILFDASPDAPYPCINQLVQEGLSRAASFTETPQPGYFWLFRPSAPITHDIQAVAIPHYAPIANCMQVAVNYKINEYLPSGVVPMFRVGDVALAAVPFFHGYALVSWYGNCRPPSLHFSFLSQLVAFLFSGVTLVVAPKFDFEDMLRSIEKYRVNILPIVPPHVVLLCKHPAVKKYDLSSITFCLVAAAPLSAELTSQLAKVIPGSRIGQGYGLTETCVGVAIVPLSQKIGTLGSGGQLIPGIVARVLKPDGSLAKTGEPGELMVKSPSNASHYFKDDKSTKETFIDGYVSTFPSWEEILKVRGFQVAPAELEDHLLDHPDVADACVVGLPDEYSGELPLAYVSLHPHAIERISHNHDETAKIKNSILRHVSDHKVYYKHLAGVEFVDVIPKSAAGKLLRRVLREKAKESNARREIQVSSRSKL
ncbi:hypothetical protein JAAARDRAFT_188937 [Jaapia argillacea MUCL 33604]|uniref:AMP-dependent synthetase/ligase domain-containing protein n=1 Tax=Jaapia argillacea MUCL 33604 TaxID=933084 RepID=A0A067QL60_9AGAM|nr:hypothetical protein JAAARDRAFT_188937 [Jaapia argillacea MUCL 33604]